MNLIECTTLSKNKVIINANTIETVTEHGDGCLIYFISGNENLLVKDTYEQIKSLLLKFS